LPLAATAGVGEVLIEGEAPLAGAGPARVPIGFFVSAGLGGRDIRAAFSASITVSEPPSMSSAGFNAWPQL
jgi:hypothetical protein